MSDNELDELLSQLKDACKKNRHNSSNETNFNTVLKRIDVFINRRQMKLLSNQKRLDDLQRDLLLSECESSRNRVALEKKDFEVHQLHTMLNKAEQTTQNIIMNYDSEVQKMTEHLSNVQKEYERLKTVHKTNQENKSTDEASTEIGRLREFNKMLAIDNQRLYNENDQLKQNNSQPHNNEENILREKNIQLEKLISSLQRSNQQPSCNQRASQTIFELKIKSLEKDIQFYKCRSDQQVIELHRLEKELNCEREQHKNALDTCRKSPISDEIDKLRLALNHSEQQCNLLRIELHRMQTEKEILKVRLMEHRMMDSTTSELKEIENNDYEKFIRNELEINMDQANKLINYWNYHKKFLEEKIRQLTNEINQLKKGNVDDLSKQIYQSNENILHTKRDMNKLHMEITDKNTIIYNLYKKIECLEQALTISKQRMNAQLNEIEELRSRNQVITTSIKRDNKHVPIFIDGLSTDDEGQIRQSTELNEMLRTSSPMKSADIHKYFHNFHRDSSSSINTLRANHEQILTDHRNFVSR